MIRIASRSPPRSETTPTASTTGISSAASARSSRYSRWASSTGSSLSAYSFGPSAPSYSTKRTTWRWIPRTTSTSRSCFHSSSGSSQGRSRKSGCPVRAISCSRAGTQPPRSSWSSVRNIACDQSSGEGGGPHLATQTSNWSGVEQVILRLLRQVAVRCRVRRDPLQPLLAVLRLGEPEHRRQQQPLAAAVVDVVEVPVHAAAGADERRHVDRAEAEEGEDEQARVEALLRAREIEVVAEAGRDAGERRRVDALALLPPVEARLLAHPLQVGRGRRRRVAPAVAAAVPGGVLAQRPEPEPPAVVLPVRPLARVALAVERVAGVEAEPGARRSAPPSRRTPRRSRPRRLGSSRRR